MKKALTLVLVCIFTVFTSSAQMIGRFEDAKTNKINEIANLAEKPDVQYIQLTVEDKSVKNSNLFTCMALLDIGHIQKWCLMDEMSQKPKIFNSRINIFNYLYGQGWEYMNTVQKVFSDHPSSIVETSNTFIFRRKK